MLKMTEPNVILKGTVVRPGMAEGIVRIIEDDGDTERVNKGDIVVIPSSIPIFKCLKRILPHIINLYTKWEIDNTHYCLGDLESLALQGYSVEPPEWREYHFNVLTDRTILPWIPGQERETLPKIESIYTEDLQHFYTQVQKEFGRVIGLHIIPIIWEEIQGIVVPLELANKQVVMVAQPIGIVQRSFDQTLGKYKPEDVLGSSYSGWIEKFKGIEQAARQKGDNELADLCFHLLTTI